MNFLYLLVIIIGLSAQNVTKKAFNVRTGGSGVFFFSFLTSLTALVFFVVNAKDVEWEIRLLPFAMLFALSYSAATVFGVLAIAAGSLSLTSLVISYSLMLPVLYGLIFLKEPVGKGFFAGIVFLVISLLLMNQKGDGLKLSWKWAVFLFLAFVGNGMCSVVQKAQQIRFEGAYKNEFMILSLLIVAIVMAAFVFAKEREKVGHYMRCGWRPGSVCGLMNGIVNLFVMLLAERMTASLMFPLISAGGIIATYIISRICYREKLSKTQFLGFVLGIVSVVFLNI